MIRAEVLEARTNYLRGESLLNAQNPVKHRLGDGYRQAVHRDILANVRPIVLTNAHFYAIFYSRFASEGNAPFLSTVPEDTMLTWFRRLLLSLNHTSGHRAWWAVYAVSVITIFAWVAAALPWIDLFLGGFVGIGRYGKGIPVSMFAYGYEVPERVADYYFLATMFCIVIMKAAPLFMKVSFNFALGYKFRAPSPDRPYGVWTR